MRHSPNPSAQRDFSASELTILTVASSPVWAGSTSSAAKPFVLTNSKPTTSAAPTLKYLRSPGTRNDTRMPVRITPAAIKIRAAVLDDVAAILAIEQAESAAAH